MNQYDHLQAEKSAARSKVMFAARNNARKLKPSSRCRRSSRIGHTAQGCKECVVIKRDQKTGGQRTSLSNNRSGYSGGSGGRNGGGSEFEHRNGKSGSPTDGGNKSARPGCYFCKNSHESVNCPSRLDSTAAPAADGSIHGGYIRNIYHHPGTGLFARNGTNLALTADTVP